MESMSRRASAAPMHFRDEARSIRYARSIAVAALCTIAIVVQGDAHASSNGVTGVTLRGTSSGCAGGCHGNTTADYSMNVSISGPSGLRAGATAVYTVTAQKPGVGNETRMGFAVATTDTAPVLSTVDGNTRFDTAANEVVHDASRGALNVSQNGVASYRFAYTMPAQAAVFSPHTLYAVARFASSPGAGEGPWVHSVGFTINAIDVPSAPQIVSFSVGGESVFINGSEAAANGSVISAYTTTCSAPGQQTRTATSSVPSGIVRDLVADVSYACNMFATNDAGNGPPSNTVFVVPKRAQTVVFPVQAPNSRIFVAGGTFSINPPATTSSGLPISYYESYSPDVCSLDGTNVTMLSKGNCTISATQTGSSSYDAASSSRVVVLTGNVAQTITFPMLAQGPQPISPLRFYSLYNVAIASSGLPVKYTSLTPSICTLITQYDRWVYYPLAPGLCTIQAEQLGDDTYRAAISQTQSVTFTPTVDGVWPPGNLFPSGWISPVSSDADWQLLSTNAYEGKYSIGSGTVAAPGLSSSVQYTANMRDGEITFYLRTVSQGLLYPPSYKIFLDDVELTNQPISSLDITDWTLFRIPVTAGMRTIRFTYTRGYRNFGGFVVGEEGQMIIDQVEIPLALGAGQSINFPEQSVLSRTFIPGSTFQIAPLATASSGLPVTYTQGTSSACSVSGTTVTMNSAGACRIVATQAGNNVFPPASPVQREVQLVRLSQAITFGALPDRDLRVETAFTVSATGGASGNPVVFTSLTPAICTTSQTNGALITLTGTVGLCTIRATQDGSLTYLAADPVERRFNVFRASTMIDLSGDRKSDLLIQNTSGTLLAYLMNGTVVGASAALLGPGTGWSVTHTADLNGDGKADLVLQHTNGAVYVYLMNGINVSGGGLILNANTGWRVTHTADLNGDSKADLVLQNINGGVYAYIMNGAAVTGGGAILADGTGWRVTHVGDFDGNGKSDLVLRSTAGQTYIYLMNGPAPSGGRLLSNNAAQSVVLVGDIDADGKSDLILRNDNGAVNAYVMNGLSVTQSSTLLAEFAAWYPVLLGDMNGDGKADLVVQGDDGSSYVFILNGASAAGGGYLQFASSPYRVTHMFDYNGDGKSDLILRHAGTGDGTTVIFMMDGATLKSVAVLLSAGGGWTVVPAQLP